MHIYFVFRAHFTSLFIRLLTHDTVFRAIIAPPPPPQVPVRLNGHGKNMASNININFYNIKRINYIQRHIPRKSMFVTDFSIVVLLTRFLNIQRQLNSKKKNMEQLLNNNIIKYNLI